LLANAVNDTAILYNTIYKTKAEPAEPIVAKQEKKNLPADSQLVTKVIITPVKDTLLAKIKPAIKTDSSVFTENRSNGKKDTMNSIAKKQMQVDSAAIAAIKIEPVKDTILSVQKNAPSADSTATAFNNPHPKKDSSVTAIKIEPVKDTILSVTKNAAGTDTAITIINPPAIKKDSAVTINKEEKLLPKPDSTLFTKKIIEPVKDTILAVKSNEKVTDSGALVTNPPAVKHDSNAFNEPAKEIKKADNLVTNRSRTDSVTAYKSTEPLFRPFKRSVTKAAEALTDTSYIAVFIDQYKDKYDTIHISIPFNEASLARKITKENPPAVKIPEITTVKPAADSIPHDELVKKESPKETKPEIKTETKPVLTPVNKDTTSSIQKPAIPNSDCKAGAWDSDIDKLRIKMMTVKEDEEKILLAKKLFKEKCFSVKQVKALSELFVTDEAKYKWFDAVYPFTSDAGNFGTLGELIKEEYYLNRFKAMLRN
jgi:hypothetical protein